MHPKPFKCFGDISDTGDLPKIIKVIYRKPIGNIKLNREKLKAIPLKLETRQGCLLSPYLVSIVYLKLWLEQ